MKQILKFEVELDENNLPNSIKMLEEKASNSSIDLKALMIAGWDAKRKETLRVDLWTKDMMVKALSEFMADKGMMDQLNTNLTETMFKSKTICSEEHLVHGAEFYQ